MEDWKNSDKHLSTSNKWMCDVLRAKEAKGKGFGGEALHVLLQLTNSSIVLKGQKAPEAQLTPVLEATPTTMATPEPLAATPATPKPFVASVLSTTPKPGRGFHIPACKPYSPEVKISV